MRRNLTDLVIGVGGALTLVLALTLLDDRVRERITLALDPRHPGATLTTLTERATEVATIVAIAAREQSMAHAPLVIFALGSTVLFLFMLRT